MRQTTSTQDSAGWRRRTPARRFAPSPRGNGVTRTGDTTRTGRCSRNRPVSVASPVLGARATRARRPEAPGASAGRCAQRPARRIPRGGGGARLRGGSPRRRDANASPEQGMPPEQAVVAEIGLFPWHPLFSAHAQRAPDARNRPAPAPGPHGARPAPNPRRARRRPAPPARARRPARPARRQAPSPRSTRSRTPAAGSASTSGSSPGSLVTTIGASWREVGRRPWVPRTQVGSSGTVLMA